MKLLNIIAAAAFSVTLAIASTAVHAADKANTLLLDLKSGQVAIELLSDKAPNHVAQITKLANSGFYDGLKFHRVIEGFMAQTGDPRGDGTGGSNEPDIKAEFNDVSFDRGVVGMARSQNPDSGNSQFFIMFAPGTFLDGQYTAFGKVITGMEFVDQIKRGSGQSGMVSDPADTIVKMRTADQY